MAVDRLRALLGEDWDDTLDSLKAAPGALGGVGLSLLRQLRPLDLAALALVLFGWGWIAAGIAGAVDLSLPLVLVALLPTLLWLACGIAGALIFEISGLGARTLRYWESYPVILWLALFGVMSLRLALARGARDVYRPQSSGPPPSG